MSTFVLRTRADNAMQQVQTCLNVLANLHRMVEQGGSEPGQSEVTICENVRVSLEATIIRATTRLDKILDDDSRWENIPCVAAQSDIALTLENKINANNTVRDCLQLELLNEAHKQRMQAIAQGLPVSIVEAQPVQEASPEPTKRRKKGKK